MAAWTPRERAALEHEHLAAAAFLGRRAEHPHGEPEVVRHCGQREPGSDSSGGNDVVAAGVPDVRQRVVLRAHGHDQLPVAYLGLERRRQVVDALVHGEPPGTQGLGDGPGRCGLREAQFGRGVDRVAQRDELVQVPVDDRGGCFLGRRGGNRRYGHLLNHRHHVAGSD